MHHRLLCTQMYCGVCTGLMRFLPPRQNKTGVNLLTTSANVTTQKVCQAIF